MNAPSLSILIVDDHAIVREGLVRILEGTGRGWQVAEAASGFQALEWLRRHPAGCSLLIAGKCPTQVRPDAPDAGIG